MTIGKFEKYNNVSCLLSRINNSDEKKGNKSQNKLYNT